MVIGVANKVAIFPKPEAVLMEALSTGFDLASGLHNLLRDEPDLVSCAEKYGRVYTMFGCQR